MELLFVNDVLHYYMLLLEWASLSYMGNQSFMDGKPMGRVYSVSDGTIDNSTGVPYIMVSPMDLSYQDVMVSIW